MIILIFLFTLVEKNLKLENFCLRNRLLLLLFFYLFDDEILGLWATFGSEVYKGSSLCQEFWHRKGDHLVLASVRDFPDAWVGEQNFPSQPLGGLLACQSVVDLGVIFLVPLTKKLRRGIKYCLFLCDLQTPVSHFCGGKSHPT